MNRRTLLGLTGLCLAVAALVAAGVVWLARPTQTTAPSSSTSAAAPSPSEPPGTRSPDSPGTPAPETSTTTGPGDAGDADGDDHAEDPDVEQEKAWRPIVVNFGRNFTNTAGGAGRWRARLVGDPAHPYVTDAVAQQLATVDVRNVPEGRYDGYRIESTESGTYQYAVVVDYQEGWSLALYLVTDGTTWQISAYDRVEN